MQSSLGFSAKEMIGSRFVGDMGEGAQTRKSSNYMMSSKMDAHSQMQCSIYDDTGRSHQTMKVNRLLDRAKKVIANDTKKVEKEAFRME